MPEAEERAHMGHPDFRVKGKIFATLMPGDEPAGMVKLKPAQQHDFMKSQPTVFEPVKGGWGAKGATRVILAEADRATLRAAIEAGWRNVAPKRLIEQLDSDT
jgi:hypothetical protein